VALAILVVLGILVLIGLRVASEVRRRLPGASGTETS
jgi:hypothetical protein